MPSDTSEIEDIRSAVSVQVLLEDDRVVVWLLGEHDQATAGLIRAALVDAAALGETDVAVDLSAAGFMDASTLGALVHGHVTLAARDRHLTVRSPQPHAQKLLEICDLAFLIEPAAEPVTIRPTARTALESWVVVPVADRPEGTAVPADVGGRRHGP